MEFTVEQIVKGIDGQFLKVFGKRGVGEPLTGFYDCVNLADGRIGTYNPIGLTAVPDDRMAYFEVTVKCEGGHVMDLKYGASLGHEFVVRQAGLLDGTSTMYAFPPGPDSPIGKCGVCGAKITCTVSDLKEWHTSA